MNVPYSWLKDYVDIALSPDDVANRLTMVGLEVDRVAYPWPGVVVGEIVHLEPIKGSDHLSATRISTGSGRELSVVCGASNIKLHDRVPLAQLGTRLGAMTIETIKRMGVVSEGMLCSPRELGISDDHAGILILPPDTLLGVPLGRVLGEPVIELDIKAHRGDLFCMVGVAREVAAFSGQPLRPPPTHVREAGTPADQLMALEVRDPALCPRYTARVIRGVTVGPSPHWMADRLTLAGMRPINNIVDVTNYVMLELGQPLHAFDYDTLADHRIIVRRAEPGEQITTLDGVTRRLTPEMLLITDPAGPAVIAGIFGGERCEVSAATTDVVLEAAHFNPTNVRRTSQALALRTESSGRFEKNPDIELTAPAIDRAARLIAELAGGTVAPGRLDFYPEPPTRRVLRFDTSQVEWLTGLAVAPQDAAAALQALGFDVDPEVEARYLHVTVPTWRSDIAESADLVEEVARIVGYDRIPTTIPVGPLPEPVRGTWFEREEYLRDVLVGAGLTEIVTYAITNRQVMARLLAEDTPGAERYLNLPALVPEDAPAAPGGANGRARSAGGRSPDSGPGTSAAERLSAITLANALTSELDTMRLTLMPGLLTTLYENGKYSDAGLWFFELGRRYLPTAELAAGTGLADERRTLGVALLGPPAQAWDASTRPADFYDLKGVAEALLAALKIDRARFVPLRHPTFHPGRCAKVEIAPRAGGADPAGSRREWRPVGVLGEVHPEVAARFDLSGRPYLMELDLERLYSATGGHVQHAAPPRYPAVQRDLAVVVPNDTPEVEVRETIRAAGGDLLRALRLFDVYTGESIGRDKKSLAYALSYQSPERTLTDAAVEAVQARILAALSDRFGATLRA